MYINASTPVAALEGFTFGCDPELFVTDENGRFVSAAGLIPGDKCDPYPVERGAVQVDGMAAEFNIDPVSTFEDWNNSIVTVLRQLKGFLPKGYNLSALPSVVFDKDVWKAAPEDAKVLGCSPDFNAWTGGMNNPPQCKDQPTLRTASGHIHFGWTEGADLGDIEHLTNCQDLVKQLDWYLGAWSLRHDRDATRRKLYGNAGACRYKEYGVEYRVLSNFWLTSKKMRLEVWNRMNMAIHDMADNFLPVKASNWSEFVIQSINTSQMFDGLENVYSYPIKKLQAHG